MKTILLILTFGFYATGFSQTGGNFAFPFIDLTYNARAGGLGGDFITAKDQDINIGIANPSLLNKSMAKSIGFNQSLMAGRINYGMVNYAFTKEKLGTISTYIQYVSYGKFERTEVNGISEGTFSPFEMVAGGGIGRELNPRISIGANTKFIYSQLETYTSFGAALDLAGTYYHEDKGFLVTALVKNAGVQFNSYVKNTDRSPLPVEFQLATSYKLAHAPFRISVLAHHLNKWDLSYNDPNLKPTIDALTGDTIPVPKAGFVEKVGRHLSFQLEGLLSKNIHIRTGFDYQRRKEMMLESRPGLAGFSFGLGLYFKKFSIDYGFLIYSRAGFNNIISLTTNLEKWRK